MLRCTLISGLALLAATLVAVEPASAQRGQGNPFQQGGRETWAPSENEQERREVPLNSILRNLRERYGGRHLDANKVRDRWVIPWITADGKRLTIEVDAETGRVISTR